jgi:hypothetical protein
MDALVLRQIGFKIILHDAVVDGKLVGVSFLSPCCFINCNGGI